MSKELLNSFKEIVIETPVDKIIKQIRELVSSGQLQAGDKLPPERLLSERFGVGRSHVRDAIQKLEFYGILKTLPQNGTIVAGLGITALEGLITDVLKLEGPDFHSLVETRVLLETNSAHFAALRRNEEDIESLTRALKAYEAAVMSGSEAVEEDLLFHLEIAKAGKNSVLNSLMMIVTPDILTYFTENHVCAGDRPITALEEHYRILEHIKNRDASSAEKVMKEHLQEILNYSIESENLNGNGYGKNLT